MIWVFLIAMVELEDPIFVIRANVFPAQWGRGPGEDATPPSDIWSFGCVVLAAASAIVSCLWHEVSEVACIYCDEWLQALGE